MELPTAEQVRLEAMRKGLSIPQLCDMADLHPSLFHKWAKGKSPTLRTVQKLIDALSGVPDPPTT